MREGDNLDLIEVRQERETLTESAHVKLIVDSTHSTEELVGFEVTFHHPVNVVDIETTCFDTGLRLCL